MSPNTYLDALLSLPILYDAAMISHDGKWAAWTWYRTGPTADVYVVPTDGSAAPLRLTDTGEDTELIGWAPDSRALLVKHDHQGDELPSLAQAERAHIGRVLEAVKWNKKEAARVLAISRGTLYRKIVEYVLEPEARPPGRRRHGEA